MTDVVLSIAARDGFKALGAGDVAREDGIDRVHGRQVTAFQSPRCGRCGSRGPDSSVTRRGGARCFKALGAGDVAREVRRDGRHWHASARVSKPSVRAMWLARSVHRRATRSRQTGFKALGAGDVARERSNMRPTIRRWSAVSKPSVRAMWLARVGMARSEPEPCRFKALGAGDVAREVGDRHHGMAPVISFKALGAGDVAREVRQCCQSAAVH